MLITKLEPFGSRVKIYINNDFAFVLYKGEISKYGLKEGDVEAETPILRPPDAKS